MLVVLLGGPARAAEPAEVAKGPSPEEVASHQAHGEVWYGGEWRRIDRLLDTCRTAREAEKQHRQAADAVQERVEEIRKTLAERTAAYRSETKPLEQEKAQAEERQATARRVLSMPPPRKPTGMKAMRGASRDVRRRVEEANRQYQREYEKALQRYKKLRDQAAEASEQARKTIDRCEKMLDQHRAFFEADRKRGLADRARAVNERREIQRQARACRAEILSIAAVLREVPKAVRLRFAAVEWQDEFYTLNELRSMHGWMAAKIEADRKELKEKLAADGRSLPDTWTHPDRAEADALKACIADAEADTAKAKRAVK